MASPSSKTETFPPLSPSANAAVQQASSYMDVRRRRTSSNLGGDPRGDTGGNSIATSPMSQQMQSSSGRNGGSKSKGGKRKKAKTLFNRWKRMSLRHTWVNPLILVLVLLAAYYINPGEQNPLHHAIFLSYANPPLNERTNTLPAHIGNVTQYGKGPKDFAFVGFYTIVLTFTREFIMQRIIKPIALWFGIKNKGKQARFMEQFYTAIYFAIFGPFGLYVMSRTPVWYFNTAGMYEGFPHRAHEAVFKAYYLLQAAYWAQQGLVLMLQLEKPRKDFKELVVHHIVTLALIGLSYRFHFTYIGVAVYITHDVSDFFLATSKVLNYIDSPITGPYFVMFMFIWAYLRHYINLRIIYSMLPGGEFRTVGPYDLNWDTQQYKCWISQSITFALLAILQAVNLFWFFLIGRILWRFLSTGEEKDERSEDEEDEPEVVEQVEPVKMNGYAAAGKPQVMINGEPMSPTVAGAPGVRRR
ncbi:hypothetical protein PRZ48_003713 [Zasmidium cellare]|uniref:TLC domain-containing protein n=1 Tax=Zasmidium cellare TaxID=395010 RepID=A0ABR0EY10_ZASCE|nr:hypothetical protein PRZ48_003713 [Zasmidium cellare]